MGGDSIQNASFIEKINGTVAANLQWMINHVCSGRNDNEVAVGLMNSTDESTVGCSPFNSHQLSRKKSFPINNRHNYISLSLRRYRFKTKVAWW